MFKTIEVDKRENYVLITLNRPEKLNALDLVMREELFETMQQAAKDDDIRAIVLTGKGRAFCAGGDLNTMGKFQPNQGRERMKNVHRLVKIIVGMDKPIIAAVNGHCSGAGMSLALACDLIVAAENAKFSQSFIKVGLIPDCGSLFFLPRLVGMARAKELMLLAPTIDANTALQMGIINKVVPSEQLLEETSNIAIKLASSPRIAVGICKSLLNKSLDTDLEKLLDYEAFAQDLCMMTEDFEEGIVAFKERRQPVFNKK